jgi:NADH-quinone oxidoreductase subunit H
MNEVLIILVKAIVVILLPLAVIPLILQVERRGAGFIQRRLGPNRVGPFGFLQPLADVVKFLFKEEVVPSHVKPFFYKVAPVFAVAVALMPLASIPICAPFMLNGETVFPEAFRSTMGVFYIFAAASLGSYAILIAGWASNNKFSMLGAIRACAQMVSYELAMSTTLVCLFFIYGTSDIHQMVEWQNGTIFNFLPKWGFFYQPVACTLFLVGIFAESNRLPFDLAEGEAELVAGYHVEYSSMKFALFFMAEYVHMIVLSAVFILLFFGGYNLLPGMSLLEGTIPLSFLQVLSLMIKVAMMIWLFVWVRWSIPRLRYDQLMHLGWKVLLPVGLVNLIVTVAVSYFINK